MIQNKVAESELITLDLKTFLPAEQPALFDVKDYLFKGLILKEKDYREALLKTDWKRFEQKEALIFCSVDVIIPVWAYMLAAVNLQPVAKAIYFNNEESWKEIKMIEGVSRMNSELFRDKRVVIKGCGDEKIPDAVYVEITKTLLPVAKSIMYGEPCSTVPIYKKK